MVNSPFMNYISPRFEATNNNEKNETDLYIYGTIGGGAWFGGVNSRDIRSTLATIKTPVINVHIHSNGGDAFEGVAIGNLLKNHDATINVYIDGMAASAASVIAMAGDKITMPKNSMLMVHRAACFCFGNAEKLTKQAATLSKVDEALIQSYTDRFTGDQMELEKLLDDESFLTAQEALSYGFCDEITAPIKQASSQATTEDDELDEEDGDDSTPFEEEFEDSSLHRFAAAFNFATKKLIGESEDK